MKLAILYTRPGSYTRACLSALKELNSSEILVVQYRPKREMGFTEEPLAGIAELEYRDSYSEVGALLDRIAGFNPDTLLVSGWKDKAYLEVAKNLKRKQVPTILMMDTPFRGTMRQRIAEYSSRYYLHPAFSCIWGSGERQTLLARRFGYSGSKCWSGLYCCDWKKFSDPYKPGQNREKSFLFVGRYVKNKALDILAEGYSAYRRSVSDPWDLTCVGRGEMKQCLDGIDGFRDMGFLQPADLPLLMAKSGAFVLPSRREAWGVVVQEAAAAGLPLICSDQVGASVHLLQHHYNGYTFASENAAGLAICMKRMSELDEKERAEMGIRSHELSKQFLPARWAETLVKGLEELKMGTAI